MLIIGICGGTASGKTSFAQKIAVSVGFDKCLLLHLDDFYFSLDTEKLQRMAADNKYNFDHPDAFDFELLVKTLKKLGSCQPHEKVEIPIYDHSTHSRSPLKRVVGSQPIIIIEGIHLFSDEKLCKMFDLKIFMDVDADERLIRRIRRDMANRSRSLDSVLTQYEKFVKPAYDYMIEPTRRLADVIVPRGAENEVGLKMVEGWISRLT
jgi:uridine kinase